MTKLEELLCVLNKKVVFIQTHNYPDQDALATAQGLKILLEYYGKQAVICYKGEIDKYNTIKMIELLRLDIVPADSIDFQEDDELILVDCQQGNINVTDYTGTVIGCIDHHKIQDTSHYRFFDIRPSIGACATIIASYFYENKIPIDTLLATSFVYAIRMDTNMLTRSVSDTDLNLYCRLHKIANHQILRQLDTCTLKLQDLNTYYNAITNLRIYNSLALVDLGPNCSESIMGQIADFILTLREVDVIVTHSFRDNGVKFNVRSSHSELDACEIVQKALKNIGNGGGHSTMAAGFIPDIINASVAQTISNITEERIIKYVCSIMNWPTTKRNKFRKFRQFFQG